MAVDDHGIEAIRKAAEEVTPGDKSDYYIKVSDIYAQAILQAILDYLAGGDPKNYSVSTNTTPGTAQTLITFTVASGFKYRAHKVVVTCRYEGIFKIYRNTDLIGSGRTGAVNQNVTFQFNIYDEFAVGDVFKLEFIGESYRPAASIEAYLHGREITL